MMINPNTGRPVSGTAKLLRMYETTEDNSVAWLLFNELDKINLWDDQKGLWDGPTDGLFDYEEIPF